MAACTCRRSIWRCQRPALRAAVRAIFAGGVGLLFQAERIGAGAFLPAPALLVIDAPRQLRDRRRRRVSGARAGAADGAGRAELARSTPAAAPVALYRLERWRGSLRYYLNRRCNGWKRSRRLRAFLSAAEPVYVVMLRRDYWSFGTEHSGLFADGASGRRWHDRARLRRQRWGFLVVVTNVPRRGSRRFY